MRRIIIDLNKNRYKDIWPIYNKASSAPEGWTGWPNNKQFALVLTHDVDTRRGEERCLDLMNLEKELGFRSAYFFVPGICKNCSPIQHRLKRINLKPESMVYSMMENSSNQEVCFKRELFLSTTSYLNGKY